MIIERLRREHHNVERLLVVLEREVKVLDHAGHTDYEVLRGIMGYFALYPEVYHHPQEDLVFAKLKIRDPAAAAKVGDLAREHRNGTELLQRAAQAVAAVFADSEVLLRENVVKTLRDFIEHQRRHMKMEDRDFFPAALKALQPQDWTEIASTLTSHNDPLFSDAAEQTFDTLRARFMHLAHEAEVDRYCEAFARLAGDARSDHWRYRF
jgi:hemerythrin-like domain-containing protein